jgi:hypothetical protein
MGTPRRLQPVLYSVFLISASLITLVIFGVYSLEILYIVSLCIFVAIIEMTSPSEISIPWRTSLYRVVIAGLVVFLMLSTRAVLLLIPDQYSPISTIT